MTSLLQVLKDIKSESLQEEKEKSDILDAIKLPDIDLKNSSIESLEEYIYKCSYLNIQDTKSVIEEYLWRIGENKEKFNSIFSPVAESWDLLPSYINKRDSVIALEVNRYFPRGNETELNNRLYFIENNDYIKHEEHEYVTFWYGRYSFELEEYNRRICRAAEIGNIRMLDWLFENNYPLDWQIRVVAIRNGNNEVLNWGLNKEIYSRLPAGRVYG